MQILKIRKTAGFNRFDAVVLALYAGVLAWAIPHHRDWADEAQAWLIARDSSLHELLFRRLHYEGGPALWPLILWVIARLHLPYASINWIGGAFAVAGIFLLLRFAPFPRIFRWLMPFTFFLQYQYAVIARPYVLFPALLFTLCILFTLARPRPIVFAVVAGLLANISLHAAIIAGVFSLLYLRNLLRLPRQRYAPRPVTPRRIAIAAGVFALLAFFSAAVALPAPDAVLAGSTEKFGGSHHNPLQDLVPEEQLPPNAPALDPPLVRDADSDSDEGEPEPTAFQTAVDTLEYSINISANAACYPIARSNLLAVAFLASIALWLWSRRCLSLMLPYFVAIVLSVHIWVWDHHTGLFLLSLVAAAWIALQTHTRSRGPRWIQSVFATLSLMVIVLQIGWTIHCIRAEASSPYDPGRATAKFLARNYAGKRIAGFAYESVSAQPYASHNLFFNQPKAYWVWSSNTLIDRRRSEALAQHPDAVVVGDFISRDEAVLNQWLPLMPAGEHYYAGMLQFWQDHGYRVTHTFCGDRYTRLGASSSFCEDIMEPVSVTQPSH